MINGKNVDGRNAEDIPEAPDSASREATDQAIIRLVHEFAWRVDHGQADRVHELFTETGTLRGAGLELVGRAAIARWGSERAAMARASRHLCVGTRTTLDGFDRARAVTSVIAFRHDGPLPGPPVPFGVGDYHDEIVLEPDGQWRFAARYVDLVFQEVSR
jgi:hypothetical protein